MTTKRITLTGLVAALYFVLTVCLPFPAYGEIQFRLSEVLNLLAFINPAFAPGLILGCFAANIFSSVNPVFDCIFGTLSTALTMLYVVKFSKNLLIASLWPVVFCVIIGGMIMFTSGLAWSLFTFASITGSVMAGELAVMILVGYPLFKYLMRNEKLITYLRSL